ncbi:hypothetical protein I312_103651 [Cryptococcus bacillisporus CA1280]|uniref:Uncharacterized protein n=1 Tax=Cryptococcus bacillisporus CA1280 TaxID=1296109 RepID=A0A0D0V950_CRYGA|nr:hypothetical protein I312_06772 [Cryptococcus bacillisporus CA1280]
MERPRVSTTRTSPLPPITCSLVRPPSPAIPSPSLPSSTPSRPPSPHPSLHSPHRSSPSTGPCPSSRQLLTSYSELSHISPSCSTLMMLRSSSPSLAAHSSPPASVIPSQTKTPSPIPRMTICQPEISSVDPRLLEIARLILRRPPADWKCLEQALATHLVSKQGRRYMLMVLPIGAGKTFAYLVANRSTDGGKGMVVVVGIGEG